MRIVLVGGSGTIGSAIAKALGKHELILASRKGEHPVNIDDPQSIQKFYEKLGQVDAVVCAAGNAGFKPLAELTDQDFELGIRSKMMGQINLVRYGIGNLKDKGSFTLTSGTLGRFPTKGSAGVSFINAGIESFGKAAALEMPRGIRINIVSPGWVTETLIAYKMDPSHGIPASEVAEAYKAVIEGTGTGQVIDAKR